MPRDTQIFLGAAHAGNSDYTLPKSSEIVVEAVTATFTDNGAGADWCPAVVMISDSGHTIARAMLPDVKVTAGDSAEASFFPGVKPGGGASAGTTLAYARAWNDGAGSDPPQSVAAGATARASFANTETTDSSIISFRTLFSPNDTSDLHADGTYLLYCGSHWDAATPDLTSLIVSSAGAGNAFPHTPIFPGTNPSFGDGIGSANSQDFAVMHKAPGGEAETVLLGNASAIDHLAQQCYFVIVYLATG